MSRILSVCLAAVFLCAHPIGAAEASAASAAGATPALLDAILPDNLTAEARTDLAAVNAGTTWDDYQPARLLNAAHRLHLVGRERTLAALKTYAALWRGSPGHNSGWWGGDNAKFRAADYEPDRVLLLCRLLFAGDTPDGDQGLFGGPYPYLVGLNPAPSGQLMPPPLPPRLLADYPLLIVHGLPILLMDFMAMPAPSAVPPPDEVANAAIDYAEHHCHWKFVEDVPQGDPLAATESVLANRTLIGAYQPDFQPDIIALLRAQTYLAYAPTLSAAERAQLAPTPAPPETNRQKPTTPYDDWDPTLPAAAARWQAFLGMAHAHPVAWDPATGTFIPAPAPAK
jgi:hypothetical protein